MDNSKACSVEQAAVLAHKQLRELICAVNMTGLTDPAQRLAAAWIIQKLAFPATRLPAPVLQGLFPVPEQEQRTVGPLEKLADLAAQANPENRPEQRTVGPLKLASGQDVANLGRHA